MAKRRFSMADEFPTKTEDFLDFVEGAAEAQVEGQLDKLNISDTKYASALKQTLLLTDINLPRQQPRRYFSSQAMESLITSVKEHGILQPLLVRPLTLENCYELVAGERRYRAAQALGLKEVVFS